MAVVRNQLIVLLSAMLLGSSAWAQQGDDALPPPPNTQAVNEQMVFYLSLVINHYDTELVVAATKRGTDFFLSSADLLRAGIPPEHLPQGEVNMSTLPNVRTEYDSAGQRLMLSVPREWMPERTTTLDGSIKRSKPHYGHGALLNYDVYTSATPHVGSQVALWHEFRYFNSNADLSSTGSLRRILSGDIQQEDNYIRYDTRLSFLDEDDATQWEFGDVISDALSWSSSVRVGGVSFGRDFSLRPDLVTWPLPAFSGEAAVPTAVDVFINGYRAANTQLQPGPFTLTNMPYINGAGDAVLVTTDALGRQVSTTLPFYVSSDLLKPGLSDGALTVGSLRRNYGQDSFDYGPLVGSGSYRYGVTDYLTLEAHGEAAQSLTLGGAGAVIKLGQLGVVNGAWAQSRMRGDSGGQLNWGYQYNTNYFSVSTQHTRRDRGYGNLALYDQNYYHYNRDKDDAESQQQPLASLSRNTDQYSLTFNMGRFGNVGAAWIGVRSFDNSKTELLNLSWSRNLWGSSSIYLAASRDNQVGDWTFAMSLQIPIGESDSAAFSVDKTPDSGSSQRINYNHAMPTEGGFSWNLALANQSQGGTYQQGTLGWRNNNVELQSGGYGERDMMTWWGEAMGSLVLMDGELFAANRINDAFAVISTEGHAGVPVSYENQPVGITDDNGYLLVSGVSAYYPGSYSIDTLHLPADISIKDTERRIALRRRSGYLIEFPMQEVRVASVILHDEQGEGIPVGSEVIRVGKSPAIVGYDGIAWLESLEPTNDLHVRLPDGGSCETSFTLRPDIDHKLQTYGPLTCRRNP